MQTDHWLNQPIHSRLQSRLARIEKMESLQSDQSQGTLLGNENAIFDTQNDLMQLFIILLNAWLDWNFQQLLKTYFEPALSENAILRSYIHKNIEREQNLDWDKITKTLQSFDLITVKGSLNKLIKELETKKEIVFTKNELMENLKTIREFRNSFAHGSSQTMSLQSARDYYTIIERFIGLLHTAFQE
jgi:hypothetical protein